jgi:hypothetical protein
MREGLKASTNEGRRIAIRLGVLLAVGALLVACVDSLPIVPRREARPSATIIGKADDDATMGNLSEVARHISASLEDPRVRGAVVRAMKDSVNNPIGLDLTECDAGSVAGNTLRSGELRGGRDASTLCEEMKQRGGVILFMDRGRLATWDSTTIPIVTAIANPNVPLQKTFHGYRSPDLVMDVPSDGSLGGPILIVVPATSTRFALRRNASVPSTESVIIGSQGHGIVKAGDVQ